MNLYLYKGFDNEAVYNSKENITHVVVHEDVTEIHRGAFTGCHELVSVVMFDNVRRIEEYAFQSCVNLKTIKFSKNLGYIGGSAFLNCYSMQCYSIPNTVGLIVPDAFSHNEELRFINVPQFNRHIIENLPDLRTTSIYTVTAKKEGVTMKAAVTGELQDRMNELFEGEMVPIAHLGRREGAMPNDVAGIYLLRMWLCFHMGKYPLHKVRFC
ncbi:MAG: leucine-rich repeat domain-containing protein, partial [Desulfobacteraceae bacterium]|nr:leucine-rich repeat domain-containing protein [Desulfobacteraceae bacterium]